MLEEKKGGGVGGVSLYQFSHNVCTSLNLEPSRKCCILYNQVCFIEWRGYIMMMSPYPTLYFTCNHRMVKICTLMNGLNGQIIIITDPEATSQFM